MSAEYGDDLYHRYLARQDLLPEKWTEVSGTSSYSLELTPEDSPASLGSSAGRSVGSRSHWAASTWCFSPTRRPSSPLPRCSCPAAGAPADLQRLVGFVLALQVQAALHLLAAALATRLGAGAPQVTAVDGGSPARRRSTAASNG